MEDINDVKEEAFRRMVSALLDTGIKEEKVVQITQKYYKVSADVVMSQIIYIKRVFDPLNELRNYLINKNKMDEIIVESLIRVNNVEDRLLKDSNLWGLSSKELWEEIEKDGWNVLKQ